MKRQHLSESVRSMRHFFATLMLLALSVFLWNSCTHTMENAVPRPAPSVYYWRTIWKLSATERGFLQTHRIGKIYLRYFDVSTQDGNAFPVGTVMFKDSLPANMEFVPTVFIDEQCLRGDMQELAERIVQRICRITDTHDVPNVREIQLDCDFTARSRETYFRLLRHAREVLRKEGLGLSVTIRLHQLSMPAPEADYGVLMMYNTGNFRQQNGHNPILDLRDVQPYLSHLKDYPLPLCAAYPNYAWTLAFKQDRFHAILYGADLADSTLFHRLDENTYTTVSARDIYYGDASVHLVPGEKIIRHACSATELLRIKEALAKRRPDLHRQIIIYHLDSTNLQRYETNEYQMFYRP